MNALSRSILSAAAVALLAGVARPSSGTGLHLDYGGYFIPADTTRLDLAIGYEALQRVEGDASIVSIAAAIRPRPRTQVWIGLLYPAMVRGSDISHAVGDAIIHGTYRLVGDTCDAGGAYLRGYVRVPLGPRSMDPFSYGSLDGGAGVELKLATSLVRLSGAGTFTLVGERRDEPDFRHDNFLLVAGSVDFDLRSTTLLRFAVFSFRFRGGAAHETYVLSVRQRLAPELDLRLGAGLDAGDDRERVFDSSLSVSFVYRFGSRFTERRVQNE